jgi:hypothetical protein
MPKHINSAYRVHTILSDACDQPGNQQIIKVFSTAFGVSNPNGRKLVAELHRLLDLFFDEVERAKQQMVASTFSADLYESAFDIIERYIDHGFLLNEWEGQKKMIMTTLQPLKFCSEVLPHEEDLVSEEDFGAIREALQNLDGVLQESTLPEHVKAFFYQHINIIMKAMRDSKIIGAKAFKTAIYEGFIQSVEKEDIVTEYKDSEEMGLLGKAWGGVKKATTYTVGNEKFLTAGTKLAELGMKIIEHVDKTQK